MEKKDIEKIVYEMLQEEEILAYLNNFIIFTEHIYKQKEKTFDKKLIGVFKSQDFRKLNKIENNTLNISLLGGTLLNLVKKDK